jgi:glyoxylase-like metal-dependent hydrolase (beta-lactamase superfamily II)
MKISTSCYMLAGFGFAPPWSVNAGIVVGQHTTLIIDTGPSAMASQTILGYARAASPSNRFLAMNTEQHMDHILGNAVFRDAGIDIIGHPSMRRTEADFESTKSAFHDSILDPVRREAHEELAFFEGTRNVHPNRPVTSEMDCDLGGLIIRIIPAPGHTPSNLLAWVEAEGVVFTGDTIVVGYIPNLDSSQPANWKTWLASLAILASLEPAILVPGHGPHLAGSAVQKAIAETKQVLEIAIETGKSPTAK